MEVPVENDPRRVGTIWMMDLGEPAPAIAPRIAATFQRAGVETAPALAEAMGEFSLAEVLGRFDTGRRCYTACIQEQVAAYGWVSFDEEFVGELNLTLQLLPGEAYIWDCATLPQFRQNLLFSSLLTNISSALRDEPECRRAWIGANQENIVSQRGIARAGFLYVADLFITHIGTQRLAWVRGRTGISEDMVAEARRAFLGQREPEGLVALP